MTEKNNFRINRVGPPCDAQIGCRSLGFCALYLLLIHQVKEEKRARENNTEGFRPGDLVNFFNRVEELSAGCLRRQQLIEKILKLRGLNSG